MLIDPQMRAWGRIATQCRDGEIQRAPLMPQWIDILETKPMFPVKALLAIASATGFVGALFVASIAVGWTKF